MEAVPRLHMLWFALKSSPEGTSFGNLKQYIAEFYQEDPESYSIEVYALETLRNQAMHPTKDGCSVLKRYYCQLHSLQNRFPQLTERSLFTFSWKDLYQNNVHEITDIRYELAAVLFNIAASHTQVGASVTRGDVDGMKLACTHFQCAAWAFGELRERYSNVVSGGDFLTNELLVFMQQVCFAQAQECILEKSLIDNRKPNIVAKVTAQIAVYYGAALAALLTGGDDGPVAQVIDNSVYKLWKKYVRFKVSYLNCILYLYQGQHAEEQRKMGERVALYQAAWDKLEEARKESKGLPDQKEINESLIFTADVVEAKRKNARNENEFIYHEAVPDLSTINAVQGAILVNGISFSVTDPEVAGDDIFARLVPMKAHEASSMYSEEKAKLLRKYGSRVEEKDAELTSFMSSLTLDNLNISEEKANKIPQGIVDRCAALNANKSAISDLISAMSQLAEICADVELNLKEISEMLTEEESEESNFQTKTGVKRTANAHITELTREYQKYAEAHARAGESNETLRKAMELHVNNLKILAKPLQEIQQTVPKLSTELNTADIFKDVKLIINKINEMKAQRAQFHADLRIAVSEDDITSKVIAHGTEEGLHSLFERELAKHERLTQLIDQNLLAQQNILQALTESYARAAPVLKTLADVKSKRESFFSSLAASYDVYEDLLAKSAKGLEFYKKLSGNVHKLLSRLKSARDVQSEERQQRLRSVINQSGGNGYNSLVSGNDTITSSAQVGGTPKLRDYLKTKKSNSNAIIQASIPQSIALETNAMHSSLNTTQAVPCIPSIRPNPLGSENPAQSACSGNAYYAFTNTSTAPNEPPPPYSFQQQFYDPMNAGYTNPIYQPQQHQNIAPPAYKQQASPNSTFNNLNIQMSQINLQPFTQENQIQAHGSSQTYVASQHTTQNLSTTNPKLPNIPLRNQQMLSSSQITNDSRLVSQNQMLQNTTKFLLKDISIDNNAAVVQHFVDGSIIQQNPSNYQEVTGIPSIRTLPTSKPLYVVTEQILYDSKLNSQQTQYTHSQMINNMQTMLPLSTKSGEQQTGNFGIQNTSVMNMQQSPIISSSSITMHQEPTIMNVATPIDPYTSYGSTSNHPGYSFNSQSGLYVYGSGYQEACNFNDKIYGQYTSAASSQHTSLKGTDSENANKIAVATGFTVPIVSHAKPRSEIGSSNLSVPTKTPSEICVDFRYYTPPYGYQSNGIPISQQQIQQQISKQSEISSIQTEHHPAVTDSTLKSIYIQSGSASSANTKTTGSGTQYSSCIQQTVPSTVDDGTNIRDAVNTNALKKNPNESDLKSNSNIDLLSDIDFSSSGLNVPAPILPEPLLKPQVLTTPPGSLITIKENASQPITETKTIDTHTLSSAAEKPSSPLPQATQPSSPTSSPAAQKSICDDNFSICSDLSSIDNFDWDSISVASIEKKQNESNNRHSMNNINTFLLKPFDPFNDEKILKHFYKEVERFEKNIESLHVKMLNGHTHLSAKWKDLQDLLDRDKNKRTTTIAKLFPEKNRSLDCLPYDHARVKLEKNTDDYINAAYVKNLGTGSPNFIIAQTPQQNTTNDFWSMVWSQKARTIACLHTPNEMLDPYWPQIIDGESHFDDFSIRCISKTQLSHCVKYHVKLSMHGADPIIDLSVLQINSWNKSNYTQLLSVGSNILDTHQKMCLTFKMPSSPIIVNCLTGSERSELLTIAICAIVATQIKRPVLINVVDVWYRICLQRQNSLRDTNILEQSMQIVLHNAHDVINQRGILTSYQMKIAEQVASQKREENKDPLNELDPLWKLK